MEEEEGKEEEVGGRGSGRERRKDKERGGCRGREDEGDRVKEHWTELLNTGKNWECIRQHELAFSELLASKHCDSFGLH